jgi:hypothetical protein
MILAGADIRLMAPYFVGIVYLLGFIFYHQNSTPSTKFNFFLDTGYFAMLLVAVLW